MSYSGDRVNVACGHLLAEERSRRGRDKADLAAVGGVVRVGQEQVAAPADGLRVRQHLGRGRRAAAA